MKIIRYQRSIPRPDDSAYLTDTILEYSEANEEVAKKEAYNGEYTIEYDGLPEPQVQPTTDDILNALLGVTE